MITPFAFTEADQAPDPALHGGKGAGLLGMAQAGLPVPEALILTTAAWKHYRETGELLASLEAAINTILDDHTESMFSVRSGAPISMPGMMDTVLNVGVTDELDAMYPGAMRRYVTSWLGIVHRVPKERVDELVELVNARSQGHSGKFRKLLMGVVQHSENVSIPDTRYDQVVACVKSVFDSWDTPRAKAYRAMHNIPDDMGTACVIQRMVMGTAAGLSGSGVMFSRDPATGENKVRGEFAEQAQGEEVVSGEITPANIDDLMDFNDKEKCQLHQALQVLAINLETTYGDVQDVEFTVESGLLYVLQTRVAKMSARARVVTACELAKNNFPEEPKQQLHYLRQRVSKGTVAKTRVPVVKTSKDADGAGLAASPGAVSGRVVFRSTPAHKVDKDCILVAEDTQPEDFPIMAKSGAIWTAKGGFTCHSAVVARGIGVPAVVGCEGLTLTNQGKPGYEQVITPSGIMLVEGDIITLDGTSGQVWVGEHEVEAESPTRELYNLLHELVQSEVVDIPATVYYRDSGLGQNVVLPIDPADHAALERQLSRAEAMKAKGNNVAVAFEFQGLGEDMFAPSLSATFAELAEHYSADFKGLTVLYGVPMELQDSVSEALGCIINKEKVNVLDLLDLLDQPS